MKQRLSVFALLFLLTACGFSPIYGNHDGKTQVAAALSDVYIESIPSEEGQFLRNRLMDRMYFHGRPDKPTATLSVKLRSTEASLGIQKDATASRRQYQVTATYTLVDQDKKTLLSGKARSMASYSKLSEQYGTLATQRNAHERALNEISEQITARLSLYYAEHEPKATP